MRRCAEASCRHARRCEWEGTLQRVVVLESGFAWNGVTYESLSKVARAITGTNWNGPRFFGLRDRARAS
jgi:hypothetical protein